MVPEAICKVKASKAVRYCLEKLEDPPQPETQALQFAAAVQKSY